MTEKIVQHKNKDSTLISTIPLRSKVAGAHQRKGRNTVDPTDFPSSVSREGRGYGCAGWSCHCGCFCCANRAATLQLPLRLRVGPRATRWLRTPVCPFRAADGREFDTAARTRLGRSGPRSSDHRSSNFRQAQKILLAVTRRAWFCPHRLRQQ